MNRCHVTASNRLSPWHNWIARAPPKGKVTGSTPVGEAKLKQDQALFLEKQLDSVTNVKSGQALHRNAYLIRL